jgi:hypothetical protein
MRTGSQEHAYLDETSLLVVEVGARKSGRAAVGNRRGRWPVQREDGGRFSARATAGSARGRRTGRARRQPGSAMAAAGSAARAAAGKKSCARRRHVACHFWREEEVRTEEAFGLGLQRGRSVLAAELGRTRKFWSKKFWAPRAGV